MKPLTRIADAVKRLRLTALKPLARGLTPALLLAAALPLGSPAQSLTVTNGLQLWLRADAGVTTNTSGGVTQWADQSGNPNLAGQANFAEQTNNAAPPTLVAAALNGEPVLHFDGASNTLAVANSDAVSIADDMSSFFVVSFDDFAAYRSVWGRTYINYPAPVDIYTAPNSGVLSVVRGDGSSANFSGVNSAGPLPAKYYLPLGFDVAGQTLTQYLYNQANGTGTVTTNTATGGITINIGIRADNATKLKGDLAELLIYDRALTPLERSNVFQYLQTKYALTNAPPSCTLAVTPAGTNVGIGDVVTLNATVTNPNGSVTRVDFFANGALFATATAPPYSLPVALDAAGTVSFTARAAADWGGVGISAALVLTAGPAGPTYLPATNGLQLWLKADAGTTLNSGGGVATWGDQSGHGNDATQSDTTLTPVLTNNAVNGHPAISFDGATEYLAAADSPSLQITGDISSFWVANFADFSTFRAVWSKGVNNLPAPTDMYALPGSGTLRIYRGNGTNAQSVDSALPYPAGRYILGGFEQAGQALSQYLNGNLNGSGTVMVPLGDAGNPLYIGTRADFVTKFGGEMAELVIYDRALSPTERVAVGEYLAEKYALGALLTPANTPPAVAVTSPAPGQVLQAPGTVTVTATASDADGSVVGVQLFANGSPIGGTNAPPYTATFNLAHGQPVVFTAVATDNLGASSTSLPVTAYGQGPGVPIGLVGYWPLAGNAKAVIGTDGTLVNGPVATTNQNGVAGGALAFDGSQQQYVSIPGGGELNAATTGTISMWVLWNSHSQPTSFTISGVVLARQDNAVFSDDIIGLDNADPDSANLEWRQNACCTSTIDGTTPVMNGVWHHLAVTFSTNVSELFLDGDSQGTNTAGAFHNAATIPLTIGAWSGDGNCYSTASIADVAVWNLVLTASQVKALAAKTSTPLSGIVQPDYLTVERTAAKVTINWGSGTVLQSATSISGPWTDVAPAAVSPYTVQPSGQATFYRLRSQ